MVKFMTMLNGQLKEVDSKEMFDMLMNKEVITEKEEVKKSNNEIEDIINDIRNGNMESLLEVLRNKKAKACGCPKCQARRNNEKSMNLDKEDINAVLNAINETLDEAIKEILESKEDEKLYIEKAYQRISDLEYEISNLVDDLKLKIDEFNDIEIKGIIYGITEKEYDRYSILEEEIGEIKVKLTSLSKEKKDLIETLE